MRSNRASFTKPSFNAANYFQHDSRRRLEELRFRANSRLNARIAAQRKHDSHSEWEVCLMSDPPLLVFDVNETLLDLETMAPTFERIFDDKSAMWLWFSNLILYSAALTLAGHYAPQIVGDDLDVVADQLVARHITKRQPLRN
jgi:hypothetical protein